MLSLNIDGLEVSIEWIEATDARLLPGVLSLLVGDGLNTLEVSTFICSGLRGEVYS